MDDPTKNMNRDDALLYWGTEKKPWNVDGKARRFPKEPKTLNPDDVHVNQFGNVVSMPPLLGVPCFGLVFPRLRFIDMDYVDLDGTIRKSRCDRCKFTAACGKVVDAKISWNDRLKIQAAAYVGARQNLKDVTNSNRPYYRRNILTREQQSEFVRASSREKAKNTKLRSILSEFYWINANDVTVAKAAVIDADEEARQAFKRARKARRRQLHNGTVPPAYVSALREATDFRRQLLQEYAGKPEAHPRLKKLPPESIERDAEVWMWTMQLKWEGASANPNAIAKRLLGSANTSHAATNSLRSSVGRALERIIMYENGPIPNLTAPLWPRFDPEDWIK